MSLLTYDSARPWAKAIKTAVLNKKMPPWFADPHVGEFRNAPKLKQSEVNTLVAWADGGAREGDAADKPADRDWKDGWRIQPDVVVSMPQAYTVAAKGAGEIKEFFIPNPFTEDTWVSAMEIRPGDPSVVHHVIVQIPETNGRVVFSSGTNVVTPGVAAPAVVQQEQMKLELLRVQAQAELLRAQEQVVAARAAAQAQGGDVRFVSAVQGGPLGSGSYNDVIARMQERQTGNGVFMTMEAIYAPGTTPMDFRYGNSAKLIRGGKPIRIEVHYTPNGKATTDRTQVAFTLAKGPADRRFVIMAPEHLVDSRKPIPAGKANYETVGELKFNQDADLVWFMPHMHLRGKDMTYKLVYPDGHERTVLSVNYNFNWQLGYELKTPIKITRGTRMIVTAHHDNSANNPMNPSPSLAVPWGELTSQEMMLPWFGVLVNRDAKPETIATYRPGDLDGMNPTPGAGVLRVPGTVINVIEK